MTTKEAAIEKISALVERFSEQYESYKKAGYNETLTRRDFIDPFFKALGWDMDNEQGNAEAYREVIHEDKVKVGERLKAPDYSFRLPGGKRLFFVEAKKPSVLVKEEIPPAYQIRRYGWSAKLPVSIITDFEEFAVYDCTKKPAITDKASTARIRYINFNDYLKEFDFIWETFSKEKVLKGSFDKFIQSDTNKKGTATVDKEFLQSLDDWRTYLATSISWNNKELNEDEINYVVQQTLDRIIFLRIAEDRQVEPYGNLKQALKQGDYYKNLFHLFTEADAKYNSGLFDFKKDRLSKNLAVDNKVIKNIIQELYYPESPYEFSVLSVEILGSAYEQFLGKQIKIDKAHRAKIEEKPEVRKAGGVYYTPQYIVDYIVKNTIGKLIEGKKPEQIAEITIVDPACGSGSFLIGAYQYLLDYHKNYYLQNGYLGKKTKGNPLRPDGNLSTGEKKRILLNNIYGVDIDVNAVEVTKLSLLLKCMEGETAASIANQMSLFNERVLPTLENNIKDGNSLIDIDYYENQLDFGEEKKIRPFNWQKAFPEVFSRGGFEAVIGNPPYVLIEGKLRDDIVLSYYRARFKGASYKIDLYHLFIEKGISLLRNNGVLGFITPSNYLSNNGLIGLRNLILEETHIEILNVINGKVFIGVSVDTTVTILRKYKGNAKIESRLIKSNWLNNQLIEVSVLSFDQERFLLSNEKIFIVGNNEQVYSRRTFPLKLKYHVKFGMQLRDRKKFTQDVITTDEKELITPFHRPCYTGKDVEKYYMNYSNLLAYFNKEAKRGGCWDEAIHCAFPKIIVRQIGKTPICALDQRGYCCLNTVFMIVPKEKEEINIKFILAVLNSKFISNFWESNYSDMRSTFPKIKGSYLENLPIPILNLEDNLDKDIYEQVIENTNAIIDSIDILKSARMPSDIEQIKRKVVHLEITINNLVDKIYGIKF